MTKLKEPTTIGELQPPTLDFTLDDLGVFFNVKNNETFPIALTQLRDLLQGDFKLSIPDITDLPEGLQDLLNSIINITEGNITFNGDNITFQNDVIIQGNVNLQDLTNVLINGVSLETILGDYVLDADLTTTLGDYVTNSDLTNQLSDYVTNTDLTNQLSDYVTNDDLSIQLSDYVTNTDLTNQLSDYVTNDDLSIQLSDYALSTRLNDYTLTVDSLNIASWIDVDNTNLTLTKATHHNKLIALNFTNGNYQISLPLGTDWTDFQCKFVFLGDEGHKCHFNFEINGSNEIELFNKYGGLDLYYKDSGWVAFFTGAASGNVKDEDPPRVEKFLLNSNTHNNNDTINFSSFLIDFDLRDDLDGDINIVLTILGDDQSTPVAEIDPVNAVYDPNSDILTLTNDNDTFTLDTGTYYMQAVISDHAGNEVTQTRQITILDATAPIIGSFDVVPPSEIRSNDDVDFNSFGITVDVQDETTLIIDVTFTIYDSDDVATTHSVNATYDGNLTIDPHSQFNLDAGEYYIKATFSDEAGNSVERDSVPFTILDATAPDVTTFAIIDPNLGNSDSIDFNNFGITVVVYDETSNTIDITFTIYDSDDVATTHSVNATYDGNLTINPHSQFNLDAGEYYIKATFYDEAGNSVEANSGSFTILDAIKPHVTNFQIADTNLGSSDIIDFNSFPINLVVDDETSNTIDITFTIYDASDVATVHSVDATYDGTLTIDTHNTFSLGAGEYYIKATFSDEAGNSVESDSNNFIISNDDVFAQEVISRGGDYSEWEVVSDSRIQYQDTIVELDISGIIGGKTYSANDNEINKAEYRDSLYPIWQEGFGNNLYNSRVYYEGITFTSTGIIKFKQNATSIQELSNAGQSVGGNWTFNPANTSPNEIISSQGNRFLPAIKFNNIIGYIPLSLIPYLSQDPTSLVFNDGVWETPVLASSGVGTTVQQAKENLDPSLVVPTTGNDNAYDYDILKKLLDPITVENGSIFSTYNNDNLEEGSLEALKSFNPYTLQINMDYIERNYDQITDLETTPDSHGGRLSTISFAIVTAGWNASGPLTPYGGFNFTTAGLDRDEDKIFGAFDLTFKINP